MGLRTSPDTPPSTVVGLLTAIKRKLLFTKNTVTFIYSMLLLAF